MWNPRQAIANEQVDTVHALLLSSNEIATAATTSGDTALHYAAALGNIEIVQALCLQVSNLLGVICPPNRPCRPASPFLYRKSSRLVWKWRQALRIRVSAIFLQNILCLCAPSKTINTETSPHVLRMLF
jgi:ankyrin repeat protein